MNRHRYEQIAPRLQKLDRWLVDVGLTQRDRIRVHIQNITELAEAQIKGTLPAVADTLDSSRQRELLWSFVEGLEFMDAMEALIAAGCPPPIDVLERALNGPVEIFDETQKNNVGRNTMFEIVLAGDVAAAGLKPQLGAEPDVRFEIDNRRLLVACKRPLSAASIRKQIGSRCEETGR